MLGVWHGLRDGPVFNEFLACQPLLVLDQFALHNRHDTAKPLQGKQGEGNEKIGL